MARRCWPASTNFPPTGPRLRWLFCICCFCLAHALETMSKDKSGAAESLMSSSPALTTSTDTRRSPSILRRRSWRRYLSVSLCSRGFGEHKTTPICTTGSRALAVEERAFDSTPRKSNCSPTLIRHSHICSKFETRVRSGLAISCSESEKPPRSQDFVQRDTCRRRRKSGDRLGLAKNCDCGPPRSCRCIRFVGDRRNTTDELVPGLDVVHRRRATGEPPDLFFQCVPDFCCEGARGAPNLHDLGNDIQRFRIAGLK